MKITPFVGFDNIFIGSTKKEIGELLGKPDFIDITTFEENRITENWEYPNLEIDVNFESEEKYRLTTISTSSKSAEFMNFKPIGMHIDDVIEHFPQITFDEDLQNGSNYNFDKFGLSFWVVDGIVDNVTIFPDYDDTGEIIIWPNR